jgi:hypothetical protein
MELMVLMAPINLPSLIMELMAHMGLISLTIMVLMDLISLTIMVRMDLISLIIMGLMALMVLKNQQIQPNLGLESLLEALQAHSEEVIQALELEIPVLDLLDLLEAQMLVLDLLEVQILGLALVDLLECQMLALVDLRCLLGCQILVLKAQTPQALAEVIKEIQVSLTLKILEMEISSPVAKIMEIWVIHQMQDILIKMKILPTTDKDKVKWDKINNNSNNILIQVMIVKIKEATIQQIPNMTKIARIKMEQT